MRIKVTYVVNGDTQTDLLEAHAFRACINKGKIGNIHLLEIGGKTIGIKMYGQCEKIDYIEMQ